MKYVPIPQVIPLYTLKPTTSEYIIGLENFLALLEQTPTISQDYTTEVVSIPLIRSLSRHIITDG